MKTITRSFAALDLNLLHVYDALMTEGNVTRAGLKLHRTQSAISSSLARLRETLGDPLFETSPNGVQPTVRGRQLWAQLEAYYRGLQEVLEPQDFDPKRYRGQFQIGMTDYSVGLIMPRLVQRLQADAPNVRIDVTPYSLMGSPGLLERGELDLVMGTLMDDVGTMRGLRIQMLWPYRQVCLMRHDHPLAEVELTLERYLEARHVSVLLPGQTAALYDTILAGKGLKRNIAVTVNNFFAIPPIVVSTDLLAVIGTPIVDYAIYGSRLCVREPPVPAAPRHHRLMWHSRMENDPGHRWLRGLITEMFAEADAPASI